jgi:hypothetical protein
MVKGIELLNLLMHHLVQIIAFCCSWRSKINKTKINLVQSIMYFLQWFFPIVPSKEQSRDKFE